MAVISNVQAIAFCNSKVRPNADAMHKLYMQCKATLNFWNANTLATVIPNTTDTLADGAATDGRQILTGIAVTAIITECQAVVTHYEAAAQAVLNIVNQVQVNG